MLASRSEHHNPDENVQVIRVIPRMDNRFVKLIRMGHNVGYQFGIQNRTVAYRVVNRQTERRSRLRTGTIGIDPFRESLDRRTMDLVRQNSTAKDRIMRMV